MYKKGTIHNDVVNLSGYERSDFNVDSWAIARLVVTPGNDLLIGPSFREDGHFVTELDAESYFDPWYHRDGSTIDSSQGLHIEFTGDTATLGIGTMSGEVKVTDNANGHVTHALNVYKIGTSYTGNDTVIGDDDDNYFVFNGGVDTVTAGEGKDRYTLNNVDGKSNTASEQKLIINDYEADEILKLSGFGDYDTLIDQLDVRFEEAGNKTIISFLNSNEANLSSEIEIFGSWNINDSWSSSSGASTYLTLKETVSEFSVTDFDLKAYPFGEIPDIPIIGFQPDSDPTVYQDFSEARHIFKKISGYAPSDVDSASFSHYPSRSGAASQLSRFMVERFSFRF